MNHALDSLASPPPLMTYWDRAAGQRAVERYGEIREEKIFCIGLGKTGTTTFGKAMRKLGYRHFGTGLVEAYRDRDEAAMIETLRNHDSFDDYPWPLLYPWLDVVCKNARFVLTRRRDAESWLRSLQRHYCRTGPTEAKKVHFGYYSPYQNPEHHLACYERHNEAVRAYFAGDPRFTELCWEEGAGWNEIAAILAGLRPSGRWRPAEPTGPFPHANQDERPSKVYGKLRQVADARLALIEGKRPEDGVFATLAAVRDHPDFAPAHLAAAEMFLARDRPHAALRHIRRAVQLEPENLRYQGARRHAKTRAGRSAPPSLLARTAFAEAARAHFSGAETRACLVLLLERSFLPGICALLASIMKTGSLRGVPIVILTTDPLVAESGFIQTVAARVRLFGKADLERFRGISGKHVMRGERHAEIAKYTLIKFHFFEQFGLGDHIFLDCDTIVHRNIDDLCLEDDRFDFYAAPALEHDADTPERVMASLEAGVRPGIEHINSGFMILRARALAARPRAVEALIARAAATRFSKEQAIVSEYMHKDPACATLPVSWNFLRSYGERIGEPAFAAIEDRIRILHYVMRKPWLRAPEQMHFFDQPWLEVIDWARERYGAGWTQLFDDALEASILPDGRATGEVGEAGEA